MFCPLHKMCHSPVIDYNLKSFLFRPGSLLLFTPLIQACQQLFCLCKPVFPNKGKGNGHFHPFFICFLKKCKELFFFRK